jgi:hypothetical protein
MTRVGIGWARQETSQIEGRSFESKAQARNRRARSVVAVLGLLAKLMVQLFPPPPGIL